MSVWLKEAIKQGAPIFCLKSPKSPKPDIILLSAALHLSVTTQHTEPKPARDLTALRGTAPLFYVAVKRLYAVSWSTWSRVSLNIHSEGLEAMSNRYNQPVIWPGVRGFGKMPTSQVCVLISLHLEKRKNTEEVLVHNNKTLMCNTSGVFRRDELQLKSAVLSIFSNSFAQNAAEGITPRLFPNCFSSFQSRF